MPSKRKRKKKVYQQVFTEPYQITSSPDDLEAMWRGSWLEMEPQRDCFGHSVNLSVERPVTWWRRVRNWLRFYEKDTFVPVSAQNIWEDFPFFGK